MNKNKRNRILYIVFFIIIITSYFTWVYVDGKRKSEYQMQYISIETKDSKHLFNVAVADTRNKQLTGLMGVKELPRDAGMLFVYNQYRSIEDGFWMYSTLIPLDIAFIDSNNKIVSIKSMEPCNYSWREADNCIITYSDSEYIKALEVNQGVLLELSVDVGDTISYENKS